MPRDEQIQTFNICPGMNKYKYLIYLSDEYIQTYNIQRQIYYKNTGFKYPKCTY